ncbi:methanogen output domain 1-containing protein [Nocardiopsis halophila]|uniref:methanogen output domain 1-containing protein n=1 Tax=Nocardiopsis halophila TaxID=141692 RepID=UPI00034B2700|nr:methanogen output domain 1-containing protein [Nocardiopsis halophila]
MDVDAVAAVTREAFLRSLLTELTESLEYVVGAEEAAGHIGLAAQRVGDAIGDIYTRGLEGGRLDGEQATAVLVDLYRRIEGDLHVVSADEERIVIGNNSCPFGQGIVGHRALCTMTSGLVGTVTAQHTGYARVDLPETIAESGLRCLIVVHLRPGRGAEAGGEEYFGGDPVAEAPLPPCLGAGRR